MRTRDQHRRRQQRRLAENNSAYVSNVCRRPANLAQRACSGCWPKCLHRRTAHEPRNCAATVELIIDTRRSTKRFRRSVNFTVDAAGGANVRCPRLHRQCASPGNSGSPPRYHQICDFSDELGRLSVRRNTLIFIGSKIVNVNFLLNAANLTAWAYRYKTLSVKLPALIINQDRAHRQPLSS